MGEVTIGTQTLTVYGDQDGLKNYWAAQLGDLGSTDSNTQKQSLVSAQRWMDLIGLVDPDTGTAIVPTSDDTGVPADVISAAYELANALIADPTLAGKQENGGSNIKRVGAGSAQVEFFRPQKGSIFPTTAMRFLQPYLSGGSGGAGSGLFGCASGTGGKSSFTNANYPGLDDPYA